MKSKDKLDIKEYLEGKVLVKLINEETGEVELEKEFKNSFVKGFVDRMFNYYLYGNTNLTSETGAKYLAVGSNGSATSYTMSRLNNELKRVEFSDVQITGTNQVKFTAYFNSTSFSGTVAEMAIFGEDDATDSANTGLMFNRVVISPSITKDNLHGLFIEWTITFSE